MKLKTKIFNKIKGQLNKLPYIKPLYQQSQQCLFPNGHFYSPVFNIAEVKKREDQIWKNLNVEGIDGIELKTEEQKQLAKAFEEYYNEMPFKTLQEGALRYYFKNSSYSYTDAIILYSMLRHYKPKQIIEIGSGHSSSLMLDTNELFLNNQIQMTFIDPYPERLYSLITETDKKNVTIFPNDVQTISVEVFEKLDAGDILFVDSTHVTKTGSDVNYILFEILPKLKSGVIIHFHDIFYPFEYPKDWIYRGYNWNEDYILRAFLMYNNQYEIKFFNHYLHLLHSEVYKNMPLSYQNIGGSLWIQKK
jgi:predicted O-methyltransferase YrrM